MRHQMEHVPVGRRDHMGRHILEGLTDPMRRMLLERDEQVVCLTVHEDHLYSGSDEGTIEIRNFGFPSLTPYTKQILEENLAILGEMAHAEHTHQPKIVEELAEKLHPDFKERLLRQHSFKVITFFNHAEVILRVQTEICIEALLDAIHSEDQTRTSQLLDQLQWINPEHAARLYELLWEACGRVERDRYGEDAFHNREGCYADLFQKEKAVVTFKQSHLKERWEEDEPLLSIVLKRNSENIS